MEKIAVILGQKILYSQSLTVGLGALCAVLMFLSLYLKNRKNAVPGIWGAALAAVLGLILGRFCHWYCQADAYESFGAAFRNFRTGSFALMGVFAACLLSAWILKLTKLETQMGYTLDCMAVAGCLGMAVGRLGFFFNTSDRGILMEKDGFFVSPVVNPVSGAVELRLATFLIQAVAAAVIFVLLMALWKRKRRDGDLCLVFLLLYGASQVVLDSTRYDALFLRSNGFVSAVQILSAFAIVTAAAVFSVRAVKAGGWKWGYVPLYVVLAGLIGGAGYMEYHVQRHGSEAAFAYSVMSACLLVYAGIVLALGDWGTKRSGNS